MRRFDLLKRLGLGALAIPLASSPALISVEEDESYAFGQIEDGNRLVRFSETFKGKPTFDAMKQAGNEAYNYVWRYIVRGGVRHVDGMVIHR